MQLNNAPVAELADAPDLGSGVPDVKVQVLSGAPNSRNPNLVPIGNGFGFLIYLEYPNFNCKSKKESLTMGKHKPYHIVLLIIL